MICKFCDVEYDPKKQGQTYCSTRCTRKVTSILGAYTAGRLDTMKFPQGQIIKVMKEYNIPIIGLDFDEGRNSFTPKFTSGKIQY